MIAILKSLGKPQKDQSNVYIYWTLSKLFPCNQKELLFNIFTQLSAFSLFVGWSGIEGPSKPLQEVRMILEDEDMTANKRAVKTEV